MAFLTGEEHDQQQPSTVAVRRPNSRREHVMMHCQARSVAFVAMILVGMAAFSAAVAQDVELGQRVWTEKAGCPQCHGWAGDGLVSGFQSPAGLPLRKTQLTRDQIRMTIQCGRPGTPMPHFDRFAYTDKRCYGVTAKDLGNNLPNRADTTLQPWEIDAVADYVAAKLKGAGPITQAECAAYFGPTGAQCAKYPAR
jgi:mono/diheme cytochrome c family protein